MRNKHGIYGKLNKAIRQNLGGFNRSDYVITPIR